jgi:Immunity protein 51
MPDSDRTDKSSYAPFILVDRGKHKSLILTDRDMIAKAHVFEERKAEGWIGNGHDWTSIAQVLLTEQLPDLQSNISFDPGAGMFSASGARPALERLATVMLAAFESDEILRGLLSRAELD